MDEWMTTAEAAERLGVKPQTLYAYVSRGQLTRRAGDSGHTSLFHRTDVERLAERRTRRSREGRVDVHIDSSIPMLDPDGRLSYRCVDLEGLPREPARSFEEVAEWLWAGEWQPVGDWTPPASAGAVAATVGAA